MHALSIQPELILSRAKLRRDENRLDEFDDIVDLLTDYRSDSSEETGNLILFIADACMGENHLWQDMGLESRDVLSKLMQTHFPQLFAKNTGNMKWKKFFYKQLCERADIMICKSPTCGVCVDYNLCFGAEDADS
ncbi:MAG: nitrogen fixation protein NifQ [Methylophilus sp.]|nr:nitrogen fixation protein NifQ [Methylophilus sp.]